MQDADPSSRRDHGEAAAPEQNEEMERDEDDDEDDEDEMQDSGVGGVGQMMDREKTLSKALMIVSKRMQTNFQCSFHVGLMHFRNQNYPKAKEVFAPFILATQNSSSEYCSISIIITMFTDYLLQAFKRALENLRAHKARKVDPNR
jgi:hypothetical protein